MDSLWIFLRWMENVLSPSSNSSNVDFWSEYTILSDRSWRQLILLFMVRECSIQIKRIFLTQLVGDKTRKWCVKRFTYSESSVEKNSKQYWLRRAQRNSQVAQRMGVLWKKVKILVWRYHFIFLDYPINFAGTRFAY